MRYFSSPGIGSFRDLYAICGVRENATDESLSRAYLSRKYKYEAALEQRRLNASSISQQRGVVGSLVFGVAHYLISQPHLGDTETVQSALTDLNDAYAVLSNPKFRKKYDAIAAHKMKQLQRAKTTKNNNGQSQFSESRALPTSLSSEEPLESEFESDFKSTTFDESNAAAEGRRKYRYIDFDWTDKLGFFVAAVLYLYLYGTTKEDKGKGKGKDKGKPRNAADE